MLLLMNTLDTGFGFWNPLVWLAALLAAVIIALVIRSFGAKDYKKGTDQTLPFLSGDKQAEVEYIHVRASNLYWGYLEALKGYYSRVVPLHTGIMTDYLLWLFGTMAAVMIIGLLV